MLHNLDMDTMLRALEWQAGHEPVYMVGVSEKAVGRIRSFLDKAEKAHPDRFLPPPDGSGAVRKGLRYLCTLIPLSVPDDRLASEVHAVLGNPAMAPVDVEIILGEYGAVRGEYTGRQLRHAGALLRTGARTHHVAQETGVCQREVKDISAYLDVQGAFRDRLWELALRFIDRGEHSPRTFSQESGVSPKVARGVLATVRRGMEAEPCFA